MCDGYGHGHADGHVQSKLDSGSHSPGEFSLNYLRKNDIGLSIQDSFFYYSFLARE